MKTILKNTAEATGAVLLGLMVVAAMWAFLGIYGISEGSTDLCTESFKSAVEAVAKLFI